MASDEAYMGSVELWPISWAPMNWAVCNGALLPIQTYNALYSLLGVNFGGNGTTNFGIPNMMGRVPVGMGQQPGQTNFILGKTGGSETVQLTSAQGPVAPHTHPATSTDPVFAAAATGTVTPGASSGGHGVTPSNTPVSNYPMALAAGTNNYATTANANMGSTNLTITVNVTKSSAGSVAVGQNPAMSATQAHENMMPYQVLNYIICLSGLYPPRS